MLRTDRRALPQMPWPEVQPLPSAAPKPTKKPPTAPRVTWQHEIRTKHKTQWQGDCEVLLTQQAHQVTASTPQLDALRAAFSAAGSWPGANHSWTSRRHAGHTHREGCWQEVKGFWCDALGHKSTPE